MSEELRSLEHKIYVSLNINEENPFYDLLNNTKLDILNNCNPKNISEKISEYQAFLESLETLSPLNLYMLPDKL